MDQAIVNAGKIWAEQAQEQFYMFCLLSPFPFQVEDVREYASRKGLSDPPSLRAWGSVVARARKQNLIKHVGYDQVSNPKAHCATSSLWVSLIFNNKARFI